MTTLPTIHINGTGAETLRAEYQALFEALAVAEARLLAATCNGRDFYPQGPDAYYVARFERSEMLAKLREVMDYANAWRDHASALRQTPTPEQLQAIRSVGAIFQKMADTITAAFQQAMLDPEQRDRLQQVAAALKVIRDRNA